MTETLKNKTDNAELYDNAPKKQRNKRLMVKILLLMLSILLLTLFYILRKNTAAMEWVSLNISAPYRNAAGAVSELLTFGSYRAPSLTEIIYTLAILWLIIYLVRTAVLMVKQSGTRIKILAMRLFTVLLVVVYIWTCLCWVWGSVYAAPGFSEKSGIQNSGVTTEALTAAALFFAGGANRLSGQVERDAGNHYNEPMDRCFDNYENLYSPSFREEFPFITGKTRRPVSMYYSFIMSITNFTGFYFPFTGQSNLNTGAPACLIPSTISHELAHQLGVAAEDEANFVGIVSCITSGDTVYEYSGYLSGLIHLLNAVYTADRDAWAEIYSSLSPCVRQDLQDNNEYWAKYETKAADAVSAVYDSFLKSNGQDMGVRSYGACVNLLVHWLGQD